MKNTTKVIHIYHGTQASGGLYLKEILDGLSASKFSQEKIVSFYYPFDANYKYFFKYTDLASKMRKTKVRLVIRYFELTIGLIRSFFVVKKYQPQIINYSLNSHFKIEFLFLKYIKKQFKLKLFITCHDVYPLVLNHELFNSLVEKQKDFFGLADYLIVHNQHDIDGLIENYNQNVEKIKLHPFPIMDLSKLELDVSENPVQLYDFCFLGHLRAAKGIFLLLDAWEKFHEKYPEAKLIIAGNKPKDIVIDKKKLSKLNIDFILNYISDEKYLEILSQSKCAVLPYIKGSNSGILSTLISTNTEIIASDIPLFKNHSFLTSDNLFKSDDCESLYNKLSFFYKADFAESRRDKIDNYRKQFVIELNQVYDI